MLNQSITHGTHFVLASQTSTMLEKRWWCSVLVMASLSSVEFLNMRTRISRLCRYECSEEITSNMACSMRTEWNETQTIRALFTAIAVTV